MTDQLLLQTAAGAEYRPFEVRCISCGARMRDDPDEDAFGQCWKCFYRMLNDHLSAQMRRPQPLFASDR